jgi:hypothetical protein
MPSFIFSSPFDFCLAGDHKICLGTKSFHGTKNPQLAASKHFGEPCSFAGLAGNAAWHPRVRGLGPLET